MEMVSSGPPWWGLMIGAALCWVAGFLAGVGSGRSAAQAQMIGLSALARNQGAMIPGIPGGPLNATQRQA